MASYTGGTATSGTTTSPYTYGYPGGIYVYGGGLSASAGSGSTASCTGGITATFTWMSSTLPPPSAVIIEQSAEARTQGSTVDGVYTPPASCSMNNPYSSPGSSSSPGTLVGTQYSAKSNPGASFSVACSGLSSSATPQASSAGSFVSASVSYAAAAFPVTINPGGATSDGSGGWDILVGQGCTASLVGVPSDCTVSNYQWKVGGTTFQSWSGGTSASAYVDGSGPTTNPTAHWYWNESAATETITCTAKVTPPTGQGSSFPIIITQKVKVMVPPHTVVPVVGQVQLNTFRPGAGGNSWLYAGPNLTDAQSVNGFDWYVSVTTPTLFGSGGLWEAVQIITVGRSRTPNNGSAQPSQYSGQTGLDQTCPYGSTHVADGTTSREGDSPGYIVENAYQSYSAGESFVDYMLYCPPGNDSAWVPFYKLAWKWNATASRPGTSWTNWDPTVNPGAIVKTSDSDYNGSHPSWTSIPTGAW